MIQVKTVSARTNPTDYFDEGLLEVGTFEKRGKERSAYLTELSIQEIVGNSDHNTLIVNKNATSISHHPNVEVCVRVYDGYNE